jgi:hypothetical protein
MSIEGEEVQPNGVEYIINKIISENFQNLERERVIQL